MQQLWFYFNYLFWLGTIPVKLCRKYCCWKKNSQISHMLSTYSNSHWRTVVLKTTRQWRIPISAKTMERLFLFCWQLNPSHTLPWDFLDFSTVIFVNKKRKQQLGPIPLRATRGWLSAGGPWKKDRRDFFLGEEAPKLTTLFADTKSVTSGRGAHT